MQTKPKDSPLILDKPMDAAFMSRIVNGQRMTLAKQIAFWSIVKITTKEECWEWQHVPTKWGYGLFRVTPSAVAVGAHRIAYQLMFGEVASSVFVLHSCDNPICVNPYHLFPGTQADNIADKVRKGRQARGVTHGSRTNPDQLARGERHGRAKMTREKVNEARRDFGNGVVRKVDLMRRYGISSKTLDSLLGGRTWK